MDGASGEGEGELPRRHFRVIDYEEKPGGSIRHWSTTSQTRRCSRCQNYSYADHVVLAVLEERGRLRLGRARDQIEMVRMIGIMRMQANRILEL